MTYQSNPEHIYATARNYFQAGLNPIPLFLDGSKRPLIKWKQFTTERIDWEKLSPCFEERVGIGIICGTPSGSLEVIDFDCLDPYIDWLDIVNDDLDGLPIVQTPDYGRHVYYRCELIEGNQILAADEDGAVLIETRGQGGLVVAPGSPLTVHESRRSYQLLEGDLLNVPTITLDVRAKLLNAARKFNQYVKPKQTERPANNYRQMMCELYGDSFVPDRPGDKFNSTATWEEVLEPHGWQVTYVGGETTYWTRPGKSFGISATTGHCGDSMYVFSSNAAPLEAGSTYTKFAAFAHLNFDGDFSEAARSLTTTKTQ